MIKHTKRNGSCRAARVVLAGLLLLVFHSAGAAAGKAELFSEQTYRDVLLGRQDLSAQDREALDLNSDGMLDSADLIWFLVTENIPRAGFASSLSYTREGARTAEITVEFSRAFSGVLNYTVTADSTASAGVDFSSGGGTVNVSGIEAAISLSITDDLDLEAMESIELVLLDGEGYVLSAPAHHTVFIEENDRTWSGSMMLRSNPFSFEIDVMTDGHTVQMALNGDGTGIVPLSDPPEAGWPASSATFSETVFRATFPDVPVPVEYTSRLGATFTRKFTFEARAADSKGTFDPEAEITGTLIEALIPDKDIYAHLERITEGAFQILAFPMASDVPEPALQEVK